jgi:hypothetical protein
MDHVHKKAYSALSTILSTINVGKMKCVVEGNKVAVKETCIQPRWNTRKPDEG